MGKKSVFCYQCETDGKIPIYFRNENRVFRVAFYVCSNCIHFSGFINWTTHRHMPYFNEMRSVIRMRLVKNVHKKKKVFLIKKDQYVSCIKCEKYGFSKLYFRDREENSYHYVGYVCKNCRVGYFVNTAYLKFRTYDPKGYYNKDGSLPNFFDIPFNEYMGQFPTTTGEDEEMPKEEYETIRIKKKDIPKLEKSKINFEYGINST